jgi:hypothetical protein
LYFVGNDYKKYLLKVLCKLSLFSAILLLHFDFSLLQSFSTITYPFVQTYIRFSIGIVFQLLAIIAVSLISM